MISESPVASGDKCNQNIQSTLGDVLRNLGVSELNRIQGLAIEYGVLQGTNLLVVAPSGSGKTLIGLMAALRLLIEEYDNRKAVFLVPLKALAKQQYDWLKLALGNKRIKVAMNTGDSYLDMDKGSFPTQQILVMTYERYDSLIRKKVWWLKRIRLIVIDEINYLAERNRGPRLETTIVRTKENMPDTQIVALCPPIRNAVQIAEWLGCKLILDNRRPVPLHLDVLLAKNKTKSVIELCMKTVRQGGSAIVFAPSRSKADQITQSLLKPLQDIMTNNEIANAKSLSRTLLSSNDEIPSITRKLASVVEGGVAFHHAGLRIEDREIIEQGFKAGIIRVVACTTTLGTGINTPARMVIVTDTSYLEIVPQRISSLGPRLRRIEPDKLHQMLGRAGRPGYDRVGFGIVLVESKAEDEFVRRTYFHTRTGQTGNAILEFILPTIESRMNSESAMLEQLLLRIFEYGECGAEDLTHFLSKTLWWKSSLHDNPHVASMLKTNRYNVVGVLDSFATSNKQRDQYQHYVEHVNQPDRLAQERQDRRNQRDPVTVRVLSVSKERIEAKVKELEDSWANCSFSFGNGAKCDCASKRLGDARRESGEGSLLCNHLVKVAKYLLSMPTTKSYAEELIIRSLTGMLTLDRLIDDGLVYTVAEKYRCTELGYIAATMYLHPLTVFFMKNAFKKLHTDDELEVKHMIGIAIRSLIVETGERSQIVNQVALERAMTEWVNEKHEKEILRSGSVYPGDFHELVGELGRMSSAASVTARLLGLAKLSRQFSVLSKRIRYGVKEDLIPLMDFLIPSLGRKIVRKLYDLGYQDLKELARAPAEELVELAKLPAGVVSIIKEYTERLVPSINLR